MSQLNNYRVGRTVLWRGAPLRIAVRTDPTYPFGSPYREPEHPPVRLSVVPLTGTGEWSGVVHSRHPKEYRSKPLPQVQLGGPLGVYSVKCWIYRCSVSRHSTAI